jgi:hypothetical protein
MKSKKRLWLFLASLVLIGKASGANVDWISVGRTKDGAEFYVDANNVTTQNGRTWFWGKRTAVPNKDSLYAWNVSQFVVDCTMPRNTVMAHQTSYRTDGSVVADDHELHALEATKDSLLLMMVATACTVAKFQTEKSQ